MLPVKVDLVDFDHICDVQAIDAAALSCKQFVNEHL